MSNLQLRKEVRDGIEFFVSNDGDEAGMSQLGLSVFTGVAESTLRALVTSYSNSGKLPSETLEAARDKGLQIADVPGLPGKPVKFIPAELCEAMTFYYAFEAKRVTAEAQAKARFSYRKFAAIGIKTWILQVTGYKPNSSTATFESNQGQLVEALQYIVAEMKDLRQQRVCYYNIKDSIQHQPGLNEIVSTYEQGHLLSDGRQFTLQTWLSAKGIVLSQGMMTKLGLLVGQTYRAHHRKPAPKMCGSTLGNRNCGLVNVYTTEDIPLLESALRTCLNG